MRKSLIVLLAVLSMTLGFVGTASAGAPPPPPPANEAAELCRSFDEAGFLDAAGVGITRGECVNIFKGQASANANNFIAGFCGLDFVQEDLGVSNKGQCIKVARALFN